MLNNESFPLTYEQLQDKIINELVLKKVVRIPSSVLKNEIFPLNTKFEMLSIDAVSGKYPVAPPAEKKAEEESQPAAAPAPAPPPARGGIVRRNSYNESNTKAEAEVVPAATGKPAAQQRGVRRSLSYNEQNTNDVQVDEQQMLALVPKNKQKFEQCIGARHISPDELTK
jgi:hypothetical protein